MSLEVALNQALSIRLNLQITLSGLPVVEEWMDIHLDRWLEHVPTPPEMPPEHAVSYLAMLGSDLRRMCWSAWGDPAGMVPKLADYFKLCNIAKSDVAILDKMGETLEPKLVGSWVGVWGGKVTTGWHFMDPHDWGQVEPLFGTHQAKFLLKKWMADSRLERIERFTQSIGENSYSEIELQSPGSTVDEQVASLNAGFRHFSGDELRPEVIRILRELPYPSFGLSLRIRGGQIIRVAAITPGASLEVIESMCQEMQLGGRDPNLDRLINTLATEGVSRVEIGKANDRGGVDIYVEPTQAAPKPAPGAPSAAPDVVN